jgi:hypothetical protein
MRTGRTYRRCCSCGRTVTARHCTSCGSSAFTWTFVVDVAAKGCPRQQKKKGGFVTRSEAVAAMNRLQLELADGTYIGLTYLTTGEYLSAWSESVAVDGSIRPTTAKTYDIAVRVHIVPVLGSVPLQQLTRNTIRGLYEALRESGRARGAPGGLAPKAVYNVHLTLNEHSRMRWRMDCSDTTRRLVLTALPDRRPRCASGPRRSWTSSYRQSSTRRRSRSGGWLPPRACAGASSSA